MVSKQAVLTVTICAVISDILTWILTDGRHRVNLKRGFENKDLKNVFVIVDELEPLRDVENVRHHFQISAIGNPHQYPIDVLEVVYRDSDPHRRGGIYFKFLGGEIPAVLNPNLLIMDEPAITAMVTAIVGSNKDLLALLEFNPGGKHAAKRTRK